ncbi:hypothetical protein D8770_27360 [Methylobacterium sp. DB1607]|nr:hypothetical protein [Methylobacterium sp. DB1607]
MPAGVVTCPAGTRRPSAPVHRRTGFLCATLAPARADAYSPRPRSDESPSIEAPTRARALSVPERSYPGTPDGSRGRRLRTAKYRKRLGFRYPAVPFVDRRRSAADAARDFGRVCAACRSQQDDVAAGPHLRAVAPVPNRPADRLRIRPCRLDRRRLVRELPPGHSRRQATMRRLGDFLDGTWNTVTANTNVWQLSSLCTPRGRDGAEQFVHYGASVGTIPGQDLVGVALGFGLSDNLLQAHT